MERNYEILELNENATLEEVESSYARLKRKYTDDMFLEGEAGAFAAKMLREIDIAYYDLKEDFKNLANIEKGSPYYEIENALKDNQLAKAQDLLDNFPTRDTEWHYFQANLFFKKNWYSDAKKQLELSLKLDSGNEKAKKALEGLNKIMQGDAETIKVDADGQRKAGQNPNAAPGQGYDPNGQPQMGGCTSGSCCLDLVCLNCLCNSCGGGC